MKKKPAQKTPPKADEEPLATMFVKLPQSAPRGLFQSLEPESTGKVVAQIDREWYLVESDGNRRLVSFVKMGAWQFFEQKP